MDVDRAERHLLHEVQVHHHHAGDPEEDDVEGRDQHIGRIVALKLWCLVGPAQRRERPQRRGEPGVEHRLLANKERRAAGWIERHVVTLHRRDGLGLRIIGERARHRLFLGLGDERLAVRPVPGGNLVAPEQRARNAPGLDVFEPVEIGLFPILRHERGAAVFDCRHRLDSQRLGVDKPLIGEERLDHRSGAVAVRHHVGVGLDLGEQPCRLQPIHDLFARGETIDAVQLERFVEFRGRRHALQERDVAVEVELSLHVEHVDHRQVMPLADFEVVEVVGGRDLHRPAAFLGVGVVVADDRNAPADQRQNRGLADQVLEARVFRMDRDRGVAQHGLRPRRRYRDEFLRSLDRIADVPEMALGLDLFDFEVGNRRLKFRVPVDEAFVLVDQPVIVEVDKHLEHRARHSFVQGEALTGPVAGGAEPSELIDDGAAGLRLPLPNTLDESLAAERALAGLLALHELALDHHFARCC